MRRFSIPAFVLLFLFFPGRQSLAQDYALQEVMEVIETMFDGMRQMDADKVSSIFADGASLNSTGSLDGASFVRTMAATDFAEAIRQGTSGPAWDERIWNVDIEIQDNLATAWMDYAFYAGDQFSHCGSNTFQFVRNADDDWKVIAMADTRASDPCLIDQNKNEEAMVRTALRHYLRGHATGMGSEHEQAFNDVANLYWIRDGEFNSRSSAEYIASAPGQPAENEADRFRYIDWVDVSGNAAVGKIILDYPGAYFTDYMQLLKIDGRWEIVNKIFDVDNE